MPQVVRMGKNLVRAGVLAALALLAPVATAADPLREAIVPAAKDCQRLLQGKKQRAVSLAAVVGPQTHPATSGPGIRLLLSQELDKLGITISTAAEVRLRVSYRALQVPDAKNRKWLRLVVELRFVLESAKGKVIDDFERQITDEEAVRQILGLTGEHGRKHGLEGDRQTIVQYEEPEVHLDGTRVLAGRKSPFAMEIVVAGTRIKPVNRDGHAFMRLRKDQTYAVRLINQSEHEMAVRLCIDGLSMFAFSDLKHDRGPNKGEPRHTLVLVPARKSVLIPGWHRTNRVSDAFKVTEYARSGAARLARTDAAVGTITATFAAAWEKTPPADEPPSPRGEEGYATGFGAQVEARYKAVFRTVGCVRASISVRYTEAKD